MAITGEAYGGSMLMPAWTNQSLSSNLEEGSGGTYAFNMGNPQAQGYLGWSAEASDAIGTFTYGTTNTNYLVRVPVATGGVTTKADISVTATTGTVTSVLAGLYTAGGVQVAAAPDIHSGWAAGKQTFTWTTPINIQSGTYYYVSLIMAQSVAPQLTAATASAVQNFNTTVATSVFATNGTAAALPATYTMSSNVASALAIPWVAIY